MSEREDNVYKAKLAEQAERYDGKCIVVNPFFYPINPRDTAFRCRSSQGFAIGLLTFQAVRRFDKR